MAVLSAAGHAQPRLEIHRIVNLWPSIELYFSAACNGGAVNIPQSRIRVRENGLDVGAFSLSCPDTSARCASSVSLVFDASGSMQGTANAAAKSAGTAFVDLLDGTLDQAAVLWFNQAVSIAQQMTPSKTSLRNAVNALPAGGGSAVWDGIYLALLESVANGVNPCRAVIALVDGADNGSVRSPDDIILLARRNRVRVFPVVLGTLAPSSILRSMASQTGGTYRETQDPADLVPMYKEIASVIARGFDECMIRYSASCADGGIRTVDLTLSDICDGSDSASVTYTAPRDTVTFSTMTFGLGTAVARGGMTVDLPLRLAGPPLPLPSVFPRTTFSVLVDSTRARCVGVSTPPGNVLHGVPVTWTAQGNEIAISTADRAIVGVPVVPADLVTLSFAVAEHAGQDTLRIPVRWKGVTFASGCWSPKWTDGMIIVAPHAPDPRVSISAPAALAWNHETQSYIPDPFTVEVSISNAGDRALKDARVIMRRPAGVSVVSPAADSLTAVPADVQPGASSAARWLLTTGTRASDDTVRISFVVSSDNHPDIASDIRIRIPAADAILNCSASSPPILFDKMSGLYTPMPFELVMFASNRGGKTTDTVFAQLEMPPGFVLAGSDADRPVKKLSPPTLASGRTGSVSWTLWHPFTADTIREPVTVLTYARNADSSRCRVPVEIPGIGRVSFAFETIAFGTVARGSVSRKSSSAVSRSEHDVIVTGCSIAGPDSGDFALLSPADPRIVAAGDSIQVTVEFAPETCGPKRAELVVTTDSPIYPEFRIPLQGDAAEDAPVITVLHDTIDFGPVSVISSSTRPATIGNAGLRMLRLYGGAIAGPDSAAFSLQAPLPDSLAFGMSGDALIAFHPASLGEHRAALTILSSDPARPSVRIVLRGTGVKAIGPRIALSSHVVDFGNVMEGSFADVDVTVYNAGDQELDIARQEIGTLDSSLFSIRVRSIPVIHPQWSSRITLRFTPRGTGAKHAVLFVESNDSTNPRDAVFLTGNGTPTGVEDDAESPASHPPLTVSPNPSASSAMLEYVLDAPSHVTLSVYDQFGRLVETLVDGAEGSGRHLVRCRPRTRGIYYCILVAGAKTSAVRLAVIR